MPEYVKKDVKYLNKDFGQRIALSEYNPKKFDAAKGGLAKILGV